MASPSNNRGGNKRPTGGKAGGRAGKPGKPVAGTKDKTVRVPSSWNAQVVDPTNNRGAGQRPTGGQAGGRAGRPGGSIARPPAKPPTTTAPSRPQSAYGTNLPVDKNGWPKGTSRFTEPKGTAKPSTSAVKPPTTAASGNAALRTAGAVGRGASRLLGGVAVPVSIASQVGDIAGRFDRMANSPFIQNLGKGTTPSGAGSRRGAAPVAGGGRTGRGGTTADAKPTRQGPPVPERLRNAPTPPVLPAAVTRTSSGGGGRGRGSSGSGSPSRSTPRSSAPARSSTPSAPAKPSEKRVSASTANRESGNYGTSKTNNKLMEGLTARIKDREDKAQASAASKLTNNFGKDSGYQPKDKVDGSGVDTKKKMTSTTNEYNSKKRRYGG